MHALSAFFHIDMVKEDQHKTNLMLNQGRYFFCKTVLDNGLTSDTWVKTSDKVVAGLPVVFKLVDNLLIGGRDYTQFQRGWRRCSRGVKKLA